MPINSSPLHLRLLSWLDELMQRISVRQRLLALCAGFLVILIGANLFLGIVIQQREAQEAEQKHQYDRQQAITVVREALTTTRHFQGQINVARVIGNKELEAKTTVFLAEAERALESGLQTIYQFDPKSVDVIREERRLSMLPMQKSIDSMARGQQDSLDLVRETLKHINAIEAILKNAGDRERQRADDISKQQIELARAAVKLSWLIIAAAFLLGLVLSLLILRSIVQPLQATVTVLRQINAGETMVDMPPISPDEFGDMAIALRQFRDRAERLTQLAYTDELTGLGNRAHFDEALRTAVAEAGRSGQSLALLFVDLDNFSTVNDSLGHSAGDRYLKEAAVRLQRFALLDSQVWRYSGDKFTVMLDAAAESDLAVWRQRAGAQAEMILRGLSEPMLLDGHLLPMSVSIGIAVYPADGSTSEQTLSSADAAMYLVKKSGRNGLRFANPALTADARSELALATDIRRGIEQREFEPFYQPVIDVAAGRVVGAEALLRWRHPSRTVRSAFEFIFVAEATGLVHALGELALAQVCERVAAWQKEADPLWITVNISTRQIEDRSIIALLDRLRAQHGFRPDGLTLEITESAMLEQVERAQQTLEEVRGLGYRLGVDDFGTGYSSMVYLQRFPVDKIKIDRSFVDQVETSRSAVAIIAATVALANSLDLDVVAEGVETEGQMRRLLELGCKLQQGFYFTPALPTAEFDAWCRDWKPRVLI